MAYRIVSKLNLFVHLTWKEIDFTQQTTIKNKVIYDVEKMGGILLIDPFYFTHDNASGIGGVTLFRDKARTFEKEEDALSYLEEKCLVNNIWEIEYYDEGTRQEKE